MVVHVDYDARRWDYNTVNTQASRQRMTIIPADNSLQTTVQSLAGDLFPGKSGITEFTDFSTPRALLHTPNKSGLALMSKPIYNITESDGMIGFDFLSKAPTAIQTTMASSVESGVWTVYRMDGTRIGIISSDKEIQQLPDGIYLLRCGDVVRKVSKIR